MKIIKTPFDHARLERELLVFMPCRHLRQAIGKRTLTSGRDYFRMQCPDCGCPTSKQLSHARVSQLQSQGVPTAPWDENKAIQYRQQRWRLAEPIYEQINFDRRLAWWESYSAYLESDEWKERARRIMARARGLCEQCKRRRAVHVHHLTYERAGDEKDDDLQAVCFKCHDAAHDGMLSIQRMLDELDRRQDIADPLARSGSSDQPHFAQEA